MRGEMVDLDSLTSALHKTKDRLHTLEQKKQETQCQFEIIRKKMEDYEMLIQTEREKKMKLEKAVAEGETRFVKV